MRRKEAPPPASLPLTAPLLKRNTWRYQAPHDAWLYCDAAAYFKAFIRAAEQAVSHIYILGWDIHTETNLAPDLERSWYPGRWSLDRFLRRLLAEKPSLQIYLLSWDYSPVFFLEREKMQSLRFAWSRHPNLHFYLDAAHPLGGSHHQKIVVVDDQLAFIGGLDLTIRRWDTCDHAAQHPWRRDPDGQAYAPFHDTQLGLAGPAAATLGDIFRERWLRATAKPLDVPLPPPRRWEEPAPEGTAARFHNAPLAVARTSPSFRDYTPVREIAALYEDLLRSAKERVLIENQYLTSQLIVKVLSEIGQQESGPEVIIILPERSGGWLEIKTMGALQNAALNKILAADRYRRARVYYPYNSQLVPQNKYITVHSKVMIIDDSFLVVGSANLNNRSMGLDTECTVTIDGRGDPELAAAIAATRAFLLAHFSHAPIREAAHLLQSGSSMAETIAHFKTVYPERHLTQFPLAPGDASQVSLIDEDLLDMEEPAPLEIAIDRWAKMSEVINKRLGVSPRVLALVLTGVLALTLAAVWTMTPLREYLSREGLATLFERYDAGESQTLLVIPLLYALLGLCFFPINLLIIVTASLFPVAWALAYIVLGIVANVAAVYGLGRMAGRFIFRKFFGRRTREILHRIGDGHFLALVLLRIVPVAPNSVVTLAAGAGRIPFLRFILATLLGMAPGTLMLVLFQKSIIDLFRDPSWGSLSLLLLLTLTAILIYRWSRLRFSNYGR